MRTLQDALDRAKNLRDFRESNHAAFEKSADWQDIVNLANTVKRLRDGCLCGGCMGDAGTETHESMSQQTP